MSGCVRKLDLDGVPVECVTGPDATFVGTDLGEWAGFRSNGETLPIPARLRTHSAAVMGCDGRLLVSTYGRSLARLSGAQWSLLHLDAAALCLCAGACAEYAGTVDGAVIRIGQNQAETLFRVRDPVVAIASYEGGLAVLGSRGVFGRVNEPVEPGAGLQWLETGSLGRLSGLFTAAESNCVGVFTAVQLGIVNPGSGEVIVCPKTFEDGIRSVTFLGARTFPYAVITDHGDLFLVEASLDAVRPVRLDGDAFAYGCLAALGGGLAIWTAQGQLRLASGSGLPGQLLSEGVALVTRTPGDPRLAVIRRDAGQGASIEFMSEDLTRTQ